jgi:hypothetical protein
MCLWEGNMKERGPVVLPCNHTIPDEGKEQVVCFCRKKYVRNGSQFVPFTGAELPKPKVVEYFE